ncbi:MAG: sulfotransferase, partial [Pseudomonadota bacterium]
FAAQTASVGLRDALAQVDAASLNAQARTYLSARAVAPEAAALTDKMPQNVLYLGWISQLFPNAQFVICERTAEAVALSCYRQDFLDPSLSYADDLAALANVTYDTGRIVAHWAGVLPNTMVHVRYEDLVDDLETHVRALLDALGLAFDERCLSFEQSTRFVNTASHAQVRRGLYRDSLDVHERYAAHLAPFTLALAQRRSEEGQTP